MATRIDKNLFFQAYSASSETSEKNQNKFLIFRKKSTLVVNQLQPNDKKVSVDCKLYNLKLHIKDTNNPNAERRELVAIAQKIGLESKIQKKPFFLKRLFSALGNWRYGFKSTYALLKNVETLGKTLPTDSKLKTKEEQEKEAKLKADAEAQKQKEAEEAAQKKAEEEKTQELKAQQEKEANEKEQKLKADQEALENKAKELKAQKEKEAKEKEQKLKADQEALENKAKELKAQKEKEAKEKEQKLKADQEALEKKAKELKAQEEKETKEKEQKLKADQEALENKAKELKAQEEKEAKEKEQKLKADQEALEKKAKELKAQKEKEAKEKEQKLKADQEALEKKAKELKAQEEKEAKEKEQKLKADQEALEKKAKELKAQEEKEAKEKEQKLKADQEAFEKKAKELKAREEKEAEEKAQKQKEVEETAKRKAQQEKAAAEAEAQKVAGTKGKPNASMQNISMSPGKFTTPEIHPDSFRPSIQGVGQILDPSAEFEMIKRQIAEEKAKKANDRPAFIKELEAELRLNFNKLPAELSKMSKLERGLVGRYNVLNLDQRDYDENKLKIIFSLPVETISSLIVGCGMMGMPILLFENLIRGASFAKEEEQKLLIQNIMFNAPNLEKLFSPLKSLGKFDQPWMQEFYKNCILISFEAQKFGVLKAFHQQDPENLLKNLKIVEEKVNISIASYENEERKAQANNLLETLKKEDEKVAPGTIASFFGTVRKKFKGK